jgi:hypothetical protein
MLKRLPIAASIADSFPGADIVTIKARYEEAMSKRSEPSTHERDVFLNWLDNIYARVIDVFHAVIPLTTWDSMKATQPNPSILVKLCGNNRITDLPLGMYCIELPPGVPDKYRDAVSSAFVHFGTPPDEVEIVPETMSVNITETTAHDIITAKINLKTFIDENKDKPEILEWAQILLS